MTPEAQRIAIAEACGWNHICRFDMVSVGGKKSTNGQPPEGGDLIPLPDYLNDLNAMHKVEKVLKGEQRNKYWELLCLTVPLSGDNSTNAWAATAAQRAEAFLRTIGKWEDDK